MSITNSDGAASQTTGSESAEQPANAAAKSTESAADPIKNLKGEFQRKFSKINEKLDQVLNAFASKGTSTVSPVVEETPEVDTDVKKYVDTVFTHQKQVDAWKNALEMFPELNPESENFDEGFYKAVDAEFSTNQRRDPNGPLKAAKLAALELGKIEQLTRQAILKDEARRSRIFSEGSASTREAKKDKDPASQFNAKGLARLGISADKLAKRMKENKDKYEGL